MNTPKVPSSPIAANLKCLHKILTAPRREKSLSCNGFRSAAKIPVQ